MFELSVSLKKSDIALSHNEDTRSIWRRAVFRGTHLTLYQITWKFALYAVNPHFSTDGFCANIVIGCKLARRLDPRPQIALRGCLLKNKTKKYFIFEWSSKTKKLPRWNSVSTQIALRDSPSHQGRSSFLVSALANCYDNSVPGGSQFTQKHTITAIFCWHMSSARFININSSVIFYLACCIFDVSMMGIPARPAAIKKTWSKSWVYKLVIPWATMPLVLYRSNLLPQRVPVQFVTQPIPWLVLKSATNAR